MDEQDKKRVVVHILHARLIGAEREEWNKDDIVFPCFTLNFHSFTLLPHFQIFFCTLIHNYLTKLLVEPFNWYSNLIVPRSPDKVGAILPWYVLPYLPHLLLHESSRSAPPGIEWMGIPQICNSSFCISLAKFSFRFDLSRPGVKWMGRGRVSSFFHLERWRIGEVLPHAMDVGKKNWANCRFCSTRPSLKDCHHSDCGKLSIQKSHKAGDIPHSIALWNSSLYWYFKFWASGKLISRNQISETRRVHCLTSLQERLATQKIVTLGCVLYLVLLIQSIWMQGRLFSKI